MRNFLYLTYIITMILLASVAYADMTIQSSNATFVLNKCTGIECGNITITVSQNLTNYTYLITPKGKTNWSQTDWSALNPSFYVGLYHNYTNKQEISSKIYINKTGSGASSKYYSVKVITNKSLDFVQIGNHTIQEVIQNQSKVVYDTLNATLYKWNGQEYVIAPQDIFLNLTVPSYQKFGALDYLPLNDTNDSLNLYRYMFDGNLSADYRTDDGKYLDTSDICKSYANCTWNGNNLTFYAMAENGTVFIDPALSDTYISTTLYLANLTESSNLGARLTAPVLFMDFNNLPESMSGTTLNFRGYATAQASFTDNVYWHPGAGNYSISFWMKPNNPCSGDYCEVTNLFGCGSSGSNNPRTGQSLMWFNVGSKEYLDWRLYDGTNAQAIARVSIPQYSWNGQWHHIAVVRDKSIGNLTLYIDGKLNSTVVDTSVNINSCSYTPLMGRDTTDSSGSNFYIGNLDEFAVYNRTLSASEVAELASNITYINLWTNFTSTNVNTMSKLDMLFHFDEGLKSSPSTTVLQDDSGNGNTGTISGMTSADWVSSSILSKIYVQDKSINNNYGLGINTPYWNSTGGYDGSGAYQFNGVNQVITTPTTTDITTATLSFWLYMKSGNNAVILGKRQPGCYDTAIYQNTNLTYYFNGNEYDTGITTASNLNSWHFITSVTTNALATSSGTLYTYLDGRLVRNTTITGNQNANLNRMVYTIGASCNGVGSMNGSIDQVQILPYALTADQVSQLYNGTKNNSNYIGKYANAGNFSSFVFYNSTSTYWNLTLSRADTTSTATGIVNNRNEINLSNPNLVAYWKLDGDFIDATNRNNGTLIGTINNATGISSSAMKMNPNYNYINITNESNFDFDSTSSFSFSTWIYHYSLPPQFTTLFIKDNSPDNTGTGYSMTYAVAGKVGLYLGNAWTTKYLLVRETNAETTNTWYHVVLTYNGSGRASGVTIYENGVSVPLTTSYDSLYANSTLNNNYPHLGGGVAFIAPNSTMDEFIVYNKSLSSSEVMQLYKSGLSQHANTSVSIQTRTANTYNTTDSSLVTLWDFNTNDIVLDNDNTNIFWKTGAGWQPYAGYQGFHSNQYYCGVGGANWAYWNLTVNTTGQYYVYISYCGNGASAPESTNTPVTIFDANGKNIAIVNQQLLIASVNCPGWQYVGNYSFNAGTVYNISMNSTANARVWADAFMARPVNNSVYITDYMQRYNVTNYGCQQSNNYGVVGNGYYCNSTLKDYMLVNSTNMVNGWTGLTISAWLYWNSYVTLGAPLLSRNGNDLIGLQDSATASDKNIYCKINNNLATYSSYTGYTALGSIQVGKWYHIVCSWNTTNNGIIYINGVNQTILTTVKSDAIQQTTAFNLMRDGTSYFDGYIDDVRIYNRSLSASEIQNLYQLGNYHISDWSSYSTAQTSSDGIASTSSTQGKFIQYRDVLSSNDTTVSPYILNYTVSPAVASVITPYILLENASVYPASPQMYANRNYLFNVSAYPVSTTISNVYLEFNGTNYSMVSLTGNIYNYTLSNIAPGNYQYRFFATNGTITNVTSFYQYNITLTSINITQVNVSPASPIPYQLNAQYVFNTSIQNNTYVDVNLEWNGTNYSMTSIGHGIFQKNFTNLLPGTYPYKVWANATYGYNVSATYSYTVLSNTLLFSNLQVYPLSPIIYNPIQTIYFNVTVTNDTPVSVYFEWNGQQNLSNYLGSGIYSYNLTNVTPGLYNYRFVMNSTLYSNTTGMFLYVVNQQPPKLKRFNWDWNGSNTFSLFDFKTIIASKLGWEANSTPPVDAVTIKGWVDVLIGGVTYKMPVYQ